MAGIGPLLAASDLRGLTLATWLYDVTLLQHVPSTLEVQAVIDLPHAPGNTPPNAAALAERAVGTAIARRRMLSSYVLLSELSVYYRRHLQLLRLHALTKHAPQAPAE